MTKKMRVKVNCESYDVEIEDITGNNISLSVNGQPYKVEVEDSDSTLPPRSVTQVTKVTPDVSATKTPEQANPAAVFAPSCDVIVAPMPGVIMDISVKPGDKVIEKQQVCALEAMKMKNIICSTRDGIIASVEVTDGQHVPYGAVIIRFA